jgi:hypothetical protein
MILITLSIAAGQAKVGVLLAAGLGGYGIALVLVRILADWSFLLWGLGAVDLLIPEDDRYTLAGTGSAFQLEPYRIIVMTMVLGWILAIMVDPRVRPRKTRFDGPLLLISFAIVGSEVFNAARVAGVASYVIKSLVLTVFLFAFVYVLASVVKKRETIDTLLKVMVCAGCVEAIAGIIQSRTKTRFNIFDHMHRLLPMFQFNLSAESGGMLRNGHFRAIASAGHPIELSVVMAMLTPIAAYVAIRSGKKIWWVAVPLLVLGNLSSGSRTGMVGTLAIAVVFFSMRPRECLKFSPALIPALVVIQVAAPGALSGTLSAFFPKGGLIAQQSQTYAGSGGAGQQASRLSRLGPQLRGTFAHHNEFFGEGYGTRIIGDNSAHTNSAQSAYEATAQDNAQILDDQWLGNLLDTGLIGFAAWLWLFIRVVRKLAARARLERGTPEGWLPVTLAASITCYAVCMYLYDAWGFIQGTMVLLMLIGCASALLWMPLPAGARNRRSTGAGNRRLIPPQFGLSTEPSDELAVLSRGRPVATKLLRRTS